MNPIQPLETEEAERQDISSMLKTRLCLFERSLFEQDILPSREKGVVKSWKEFLPVIWFALFNFVLLAQWLARNSAPFELREAVYIAGAKYGAGILQTGAGHVSPLYSWTLSPFLNLFGFNPSVAVLFTNSFYSALLCLFVFLIVRHERKVHAGWMAVCFAACSPFMLEGTRHISPETALCAWVAGAYACYIWSEEFNDKFWSYMFGLCCGAGLLTDAKFWMYVIPLFFPYARAFMNRVTQYNCAAAAGLIALLNVPWYWANIMNILAGYAVSGASEAGTSAVLPRYSLTLHLWNLPASLTVPFFIAGFFSMFWMAFAGFMPYARSRLILGWLGMSYIACAAMNLNDGRCLFPALSAFAVSAGIMIPPKTRKALAVFFIVFAASYQLGWPVFSPLVIKGHFAPLWGCSAPSKNTWNHAEMLEAVVSESGGGKGKIVVTVAGGTEYLNSRSLYATALSMKLKNIIFRDALSKEASSFSNFVIDRADRRPQNSQDMPEPPELQWFERAYEKTAAFDMPDGSSADLYKIKRGKFPFPPGVYKVNTISGGNFTAYGAMVKLGEWNEAENAYEYAAAACSSLSLGEDFEIYKLKAGFEKFSFQPVTPGSLDDIRITKIGKLKVFEGSITPYSLETFAASRLKKLTGLKISYGESGIIFKCAPGGRNISGLLEGSMEKGIVSFYAAALYFEGMKIPAFFLSPFSWSFDAVSGLPFEADIKGISLAANQQIDLKETSPEPDKKEGKPLFGDAMRDFLRTMSLKD